jgi:hypothetical protein
VGKMEGFESCASGWIGARAGWIRI